MSKIRNAKGRTDNNSGYIRLFGNVEFGKLFSKAQATVISNGSELEKMILERTQIIENLDLFIDETTNGLTINGIYTSPKKILRKSRYALKGYEPDLLIFIVESQRICKVIELKEGDSFDTKKSSGEQEHIAEFTLKFGSKIPFVADYFVCSFNQENKDVIYNGFKKVFEKEHILTGKELCKILKIDYDEIVNLRKTDQEDNLKYFVEEMLNIDKIKELIKEKLKEGN